ncbi:TPA: glycosyltransferase family 2 protein [Candidatus Bathyarchaeota archaeon]|nr:glycosyltransferase family 2 protein [Candidatus Bathyarchaeota archaeon]
MGGGRLLKIDVVMIVKDDARYVADSLESLYSHVPVNRLLVVDGGSRKTVLDVVKRYPNVTLIDDSGGTRATARQKGIEIVVTDWFMFLDSDVVLCDDWFEKVSKYMNDSEVGAVQGVDIPQCDEFQKFNNLIKEVSCSSPISFKPIHMGLPVVNGIFIGDTLIRREAVKGIKIPPLLHVYEDRYIRRYIEDRGYRWVISSEAYCFHYSHRKSIDAYYLGLIDTLAGYRSIGKYFRDAPKLLVSFILASIMDQRTATKCFNLLLHNIAGSVAARLHVGSISDAGFLKKLEGY